MMKAVFALLFVILALVFLNATFSFASVSGASMLPTIPNEDTVVIYQRLFYSSNLTGKIVLFRWNETLNVCHRCLIDNGTHIYTKGDNNMIADGWSRKSSIIGVVLLIIK